MIHKGQIIEKAVRTSGFSVTELAKRLKKSRRYVYNVFEKQDVSTDVLVQIGKIIHYDFSIDLKDLMPLRYDLNGNSFSGGDNHKSGNGNAEFWKNKYLDVLEKYNSLLAEKVEVLKKKD